MHVLSAAPIPVPVHTLIPLLNMADACPTPANLSSRVQTVFGGSSTRPLVKSPWTPQIM